MSKKIIFNRIKILITFFFIIFILIWWQTKVKCIDESQKLSVIADSQYNDEQNLSDMNYLLFDKNGKQLLNYKNKYYAVIDPSSFNKNNLNSKSDALYALIYILRNYNDKYDLSNLGASTKGQKISYEVDEDTYNKLKAIKGVKGFYAYSYSTADRTSAWSIENLITNPRKVSDSSLKSNSSIEMQIYNKTKSNQYTKEKFNRDIDGNISEGEIIKPKNNVNVRLTLDKNIEEKIKDVLNDNKYKDYNEVGVTLMESSTGKILAMTQKDDTYPNVNLGSATENGFQPGSIFKIIVEEAGIDRGSFSLDSKFSCKQAIYDICKEDHGVLTAADALTVSCNNIFAQLGDKIGYNNFMDNAQSQGLFKKVLSFDSEVSGDVVRPKKTEGTGQVAIGQSMRITPIQAVSIVNTVANGGNYVKPYIVDAFVNDDNTALEEVTTDHYTVIKKSTADIMKEQMKNVVRYGTGTAAYLKNIEVGGKTGTSTRMDGNKACSDGWFIGYFKVNNKYYSMVVFVKNINIQKDGGGNTAAPIFKDIVEDLHDYLK